ncbi:GNAT family N-acetyltransferase [Aurantibacter sp.]|uniref:GNAT family N-acetyltransferase n=1 Tax=Aurantibacter sp. TaxID=2807103 RepID=UPI00326786B2
MKTDYKVALIPYEKMEVILPLVSALNNDNIEYAVLQKRLKSMLVMGSYECIGVFDNGELIAICGIWILNKLYSGKHIEPDNVFVKAEYRNKGVGQLMMDWLFAFAKQIGCIGLEVNCYVANLRGKQFWERQGFEPIGHHLIMKLA